MNSPFLTSLEPSDTQHSATQSDMHGPAEFVRWSEQQMSDSTDSALREYEDECFHKFEGAATKAEQHEYVHEMARCIVEMTNRGMSLNGGK